MTFAAETPAKHPDFKGPLAPSEHDACGSHLWQPFVLLLHSCTARTSRVLPKVCAKFSQQRPSACSYTGLSTLCLNACYRGPWRAKLCRARGTALRALRALKRSKSPQQISDWTSSVQSSTNENGTLPNGEST